MFQEIFQPLLAFLACAMQKQLAQEIQFLKAENALLRARLPKRLIATPQEKQTLLRFGAPLGRAIQTLITFVTPRTFARWLAQDQKVKRKRIPRGPGRKPTPADIEALVLKLARENGWGYTRILGEIRNLGVRKICRTTVLNILRDHGIAAGPRRGAGSWDDFLKRHLASLWACDFFSVKTWTLAGFVDLHVPLLHYLRSLNMYIYGVTANPDAGWMAQAARNLSFHFDEQPQPPTHLLRDRDTKFTLQFDAILASEEVEVVPVAVRAPNRNAAAERFVQSVKRECLERGAVESL